MLVKFFFWLVCAIVILLASVLFHLFLKEFLSDYFKYDKKLYGKIKSAPGFYV